MSANPSTIWTPPNLQSAIAKRYERLLKCKGNVGLQALALEMCSRDIVTWLNDWCWTFDPRRSPSMIPFILFPRQVEYLHWRIERRAGKENGLCEKSRDMGVTWLNVAHQTWLWLFEENYKGSFGSRKELLVDRIGDADSIFEKIRILLRYLPKWMLPPEFSWSEHDNFCKLVNPANGSTITGEAGDNIGRGGRSAIYDWDEVAFTERPHKVDAALSNNSDVVFYTSSANGKNFYWRKRMQYAASNPQWVFRFFWRDDPRKDDSWYRQMCTKYDAITVASEVDIDYGASEPDVYIPTQWVLAAVEIELPSVGDQVAALDVATTGANRNVFGSRIGSVVQGIEDWGDTDTTQTSFRVRELMRQKGIPYLNFDADGVGAGVAGTLASIPDLEFEFSALHGASAASKREWEGEERTSYDKFQNARAEWWGILHWRFKNTYDHASGIKEHSPDEMISIPNHPALIAQISQPKRKFTQRGKLLIESKEEMRKRGLDSPDFADMLAYLFAPIEEEYTPDWISAI